MNIANIVRRFSFQEWGGTETAVFNSSKELVKLGNKVEIISTNALSNVKNETVGDIKITRYPYFYPHLLLSKKNKFTLDKKGGNPFSYQIYNHLLNGNFDIMHTHAMGRLAKEVRRISKIKNIPYVISFHGGNYDVPKSEFEEMAKPLKGSIGYGRVLEKIFSLDCDIVKEADAVICVGKNELDEIKKRFPQKHAKLIPNGVDCSKFQKKVNANFRDAYNIPQSKKLILCVSRIDYQKNQRSLVKLVESLKNDNADVHCAIIGFITSASYLSELKSDIKKSNLENDFTIIEGLAPDSDMLISAFQSADVFALPSIHEPFGIVVLEAWSAGLAVIASNVGGLGTLVKDAVNGFKFEASNIEQMKSAYFKALENKDLISKNAFNEVKDTYSWQAVSKSLLEFYQEILNDKKRS